MSLDYKEWGNFAAFAGPSSSLTRVGQLAISRDAVQAALGRRPDFEDERIASWGRITLSEAERLAELEVDVEIREETLALAHEVFRADASATLTLYYTDPYHGL
ncbi:MAG: hypothetical protein HOV80_28550 [Polyangiaceae bacterium]|nr:hypothetical protein [Polyangiaceae bacterium]